MQQTLFALCALFLFSVYSLGRHRVETNIEQNAVGGELELLAADRARATLSDITALAYDEVDVSTRELRTSIAGLTATPAAEEANATLYDDVDDWHGWTRTGPETWLGENVQFRTTVSVRYVRATPPVTASSGPTLAKEVTVTVSEVNTVGRPPVTATLQQIVTPAWCLRHLRRTRPA
jgi:hypothetical protein